MLAAACGRSHDRVGMSPFDGATPDSAIDASFDGATLDTSVPPDAGTTATCDADAVESILCPDVDCDEAPRWYWNGDGCFPIECGACSGPDCERAGVFDEAACVAAHAECEGALCRGSGGTWRWWSEECEHWECGSQLPSSCLIGRAVCDCGPGRRFDLLTGCVDAPDCPPVEALSDEALCLGTSGSWEGICCHTECGAFCPDACVALACNCGPGRVFEGGRGCVEVARCFERIHGETCDPRARCETGTLCCQRCGGAGCVGPATCDYPLCDSDETIDMCGNNTLAP
jgi:hypothetical protein